MEEKTETTERHRLYAKIVFFVTNFGLGLLVVTFLLYALGVLKPLIPLEELPHYWNLPLQEFLQQTNAPTGWRWLDYLGTGDYLNFLGLALFAGVTGICYLALLFDFARKTQWLFAGLVSLELVFILFAASNWVTLNH